MTTNWAGNIAYGAARWHWPETVEQLQELVSRSRQLRVLGSRHSFNRIADTPGDLISLDKLDPAVTIDRARMTVTASAGVRYGQLGQQLHQAGFALHNLASLPHISLAGACATATHGSGDSNGNLATAVAALEIVTASGERLALSREESGDELNGAVVGLGGAGVVTKVTLDISPAVAVRQDVYENLPLARLEEHFDAITGSAYSVSLFTDWQGPLFNQVWLKRQAPDGAELAAEPEFFGATRAGRKLHPIGSLSAENCTEQLGERGAWHERLPHFRMDFVPSSGEELQTEYLVPRQHALPALRAVLQLRERITPLLLISEVRTIAADELWMSPCYRQACVAIHFSWKKDWPAVQQLLPRIEAALAPFEARPHWGKLFTLPPERVQSLYPRLPEFRALLQRCDPDGKFQNDFLRTYVFTQPGLP